MPIIPSLGHPSASSGDSMPVILTLTLRELANSRPHWHTAALLLAVEPRIGVMFGIFLVSLFAVSFPGISKKVEIPHLVFFIGKHFGTGVILSTGFCHLLPDAFESLRDPAVEKRYHGIGKWTGLIILGSLLSIFLVEYASTTYVDRLHAKSSAPSTPETSPSPPSTRRFKSNPQTPPPLPPHLPTPAPTLTLGVPVTITPASPAQPQASCSTSKSKPPTPRGRSTTPAQPISETSPLLPRSQGQPHPHLLPHRGRSRTKSLCGEDEALLPLILLNSPRLSKGGLGLGGTGLTWGKDMGCICPMGRMVLSQERVREFRRGGEREGQEVAGEGRGRDVGKLRVGRRRQIIGILVLQLGIMIHSLIIGLTLAVTSGADFMSLVTAITFHQLFEGLSLGIRIASLPSPSTQPSAVESPSLLLPSSSRESSLDTSPLPHNQRKLDWLKPTLSILFAITTPFGMAVGMEVFGPAPDKAQTQMVLTQGVLSAISAGMLIYAATVEMLGGDFVYGDVVGDHGHSHDHGHGHEPGHGLSEDGEVKRSGTWRRVLAVASLIAGVFGMGVVGLGE